VEKRADSQREPSVSPLMRAPGEGMEDLPPDELLSLIGQEDFYAPRHEISRNAAFRHLQRRYGNRWLLSLTDPSGKNPPSPGAEDVESYLQQSSGLGHPMDRETDREMSSRFARDLGDVRLHTDSGAEEAARSLGAEAFTSGRDIYFASGRYRPETAEGEHLLAHELTHTIQQGEAPSSFQRKLTVSSPEDPLEREAEEVAERLTEKKEKTPQVAPDRRAAPLQMQGEPPEEPSAPATGGPPPEGAPISVGSAPAAPGEFVIKLGEGIPVPAEALNGRRPKRIDLSTMPFKLPGLAPHKLVIHPERKTGYLTAGVNVSFAGALKADLRFDFDAQGKTTLRGTSKLPLKVGALNNPEVTVTLDETNNLTAEARLTADSFKPKRLPRLKLEGAGMLLRLKKGRFEGEGGASLDYEGLGKGQFQVKFQDGSPQGSGKFQVTQKYLQGAAADLSVEKGDLKADVSLPANKLAPPIAGLEVAGGTIHLAMHNMALSGSIEGLFLRYRELGEATLTATINNHRFEGSGSLGVKLPALADISGELGYKAGRLYGTATIGKDKFPPSLPVESGSITVGIDEKGQASFAGAVRLNFRGVGSGELRGAYKEGTIALGADVNLDVPGLQAVSARVDYVNGKLEGEVDVPIESKKLLGLSGNLHVAYRDEKFSAEQKIKYTREDGKLTGMILLGLAQDQEGKLAIYGGGDVTAQLTSFLAGQLKVDVLKDGTTKVYGAITVTEPINLFPQKKGDRELFNISRNIPLWAILVAVIRLRGGVRAGIGPGQLRDITVEGEYTIGGENEPSFVISGELFIPAYAEAYLAFGAGLGLDVVIGSLTGGIEAVGTAGIYGAVSVRPEIAYREGNYSISGVATMAAGAKIKLGLQAWAEVEALWITVWEKTWQLAEWVWDVGPTLALQANVKYVFGRPEPPSFEFKTSDIDAKRLIEDAMPKEGPKGSGAREALKNRTEWSGRTKGKGKAADKVPPEAAKEKKVAPPKAPPKPPKRVKAPGKGVPQGPVKEKGGKRKPELDKMIKKAAEKELKGQEKDKKTLQQAPSFPAPTSQEVEINWANYLRKTKGKGSEHRPSFETKMRSGNVFHPGLNHWRDLKADYLSSLPTLSKDKAEPANFARDMRKGFMVSSPERKDPYYVDNLETPVPAGTTDNPWPIDWPTQFLIRSFETFTVSPPGQSLRIRPSGRRAYSFTDDNGQRISTEFGITPTFQKMMQRGKGNVLKRQNPARGGAVSAEWRKWDNIGFQGETASGGAAPQKPSFPPSERLPPDDRMFSNRKDPYKNVEHGFGSFRMAIEDASYPGYAQYRSAGGSQREELRRAARAGLINISDTYGHVTKYLEYLQADREFRSRGKGHMGYEMQHTVPLFLVGGSGDVPENLWPLTYNQHRSGHQILKQQQQLLEFGAPTGDLEATEMMNKYFYIKRYS